MRLRNTLLITCGLLLAAVLATFALLLQGIDLNDFRHHLEKRLSTALARPVSLGESRFSLRHGPAFSFSDLRLEPKTADDWSLTADRLYIRLELLPLLHRQIRFDQMVLHAPRLHLPIAPAAVTSEVPDLAGEFPGIRSLVVHNGMLVVEDRRESPLPPVIVERIDGNLSDFAPGRQGWLTLRGQLRQPDGEAEVRLAGEVVQNPNWRRIRGHLGVKVDGWSPQVLASLFLPGVEIEGKGVLQAIVAGSATEGVRFEGDLVGSQLALTLPGPDRRPIPLPSAQLRGKWIAAEEGGRLEDLEFSVGALAGRGAFAWRQTDENLFLDGLVSTSRVPVHALLPWLPGAVADRLREKVREGFIEIRSARFSGAAVALRHPGHDFPLEAELAIDGLTLIAGTHELRQMAAEAVFRHNRVVIPRGEFVFQDEPLRFSGSVTDPLGSPSFTAQVEGEVESSNLSSSFPAHFPPGTDLSGAVALQAAIEGSAAAADVKIQAVLDAVQARRSGIVLKAAGEKADLQLGARVSQKRVTIGEFRLRLPALEIKGGGHFDRSAPYRFRVEADAFTRRLESLRHRLTLLEKLRASGALALHLEMAGDKKGVSHRTGWVRLNKTDLHVTGAVADFHDVEGTISFADDRLQFDRVTALLGTSPVVLAGTAEHLPDPVVHLLVRAKAIRADELIFRSPTIYLRDVQGDLRIDRRGIRFERVDVRLDGGTRARIDGKADFLEPAVELEVEAPEGDIDEVIALWRGPKPRGEEVEKRSVRVEINARVGEGRLGPFRFQHAEGTITHVDGELSIFPLRFNTGGGAGTGRIVVAPAATSARLHVSGQVEGVDAAATHLDLLQRRGLVTGKLRSDFEVEGEIGKKFLETATGMIKIEVEQGVLHKFPALAKVFSLLNVSQIFTLRLPDMARDGMPFDRVTGAFRLHHGELATEDLFVESEAMNLSLVGKIDLRTERLDFVLGVKPLRTVDKIVTRIPVAGWILAGEEKALITAHFLIRGEAAEPEVTAVPITSISETVVGIFRRAFGLPGRVIEGVGDLVHPDD